ncbi:MAG TPA: tripartite tricarboxylate transporter substrate binding protein [Hyphomicrobiaceae bacterium]|nr:tripartite tricarboxylate transporter substrate binding protein [Hyphomicrobiaceae bacterium]
MRVFAVALAAVLGLAVPAVAPAETWPSRPVKVVVPFPPGAATDMTARVLANELSALLGQPFVIVNKGGADGAIGGTEAARAAPDGYTLLVGSNSGIVVAPLLRKNPPYDTLKDFTPVSFLGESTFFITVHPSVPAKTLAEFIAHAKANPKKLNYATGNTMGIVATSLLAKNTGIDMQHVPYKNDAEAMPDLMAGHVQLIIATALNVVPHAKTGNLRLLATTTGERSPLMPDVPTIIEAGQPRFPVAPWAAILGPANLPAEIVEKLNKATVAAFAKPEVREGLAKQGFAAKTTTPAELGAFLKDQVQVWSKSLQEAGLEPQ